MTFEQKLLTWVIRHGGGDGETEHLKVSGKLREGQRNRGQRNEQRSVKRYGGRKRNRFCIHKTQKQKQIFQSTQ